jgi:hypothetical protein
VYWMARFPALLPGNHRRIRPADMHPEQAPGQPGNQAGRLPGQLLCRRLLPASDDDDGEPDQDEPHGSGGEDQCGGHQRPAPLLIGRSMNQAAKYAPAAYLPVSTARKVTGRCGRARPGGGARTRHSQGGFRGDRAAQAGLAVPSATAVAVRSRVRCGAGRCRWKMSAWSFLAFTAGNGTRSSVRFWEQNGSGGPLSDTVRRGHHARLDVSDVQEYRATAALPGCALSSHRGGQGFKSPQLHPVQGPVSILRPGPFSLNTAAKYSNPSHQASCPAA